MPNKKNPNANPDRRGNESVAYEKGYTEYKTTIRGVTRAIAIDPEWMQGSVQLISTKKSDDGKVMLKACILAPYQDIRWARTRGKYWRRLESAIEKIEPRTLSVGTHYAVKE